MDRRFLGSTAALVLGFLFLLTAAARGQDMVPHILSGGGVIAGALAFRSLKRRRLGLCDNSIGRRVAESAALVSIVALVLLQSNILRRMHPEPVPDHLVSASEQLLAHVTRGDEAPPSSRGGGLGVRGDGFSSINRAEHRQAQGSAFSSTMGKSHARTELQTARK